VSSDNGERPEGGGRSRQKRRRSRRRRAHVEKSSGGVVYRRERAGLTFLLIRDPYRNWGLPKGHIESDETPRDAALREVCEETGLDVLEVIDELPTIDWYYRNDGRLIHKFCHFYLLECERGDAVPQLEEGITACLWYSFAEAMKTVTYDNAREVLRAAGERLGES
jgi:8-oxo-dGTP pyrophosphatase MutT (NUDIX family)